MSSTELLAEAQCWLRFADEDIDAAEALCADMNAVPRHACWSELSVVAHIGIRLLSSGDLQVAMAVRSTAEERACGAALPHHGDLKVAAT